MKKINSYIILLFVFSSIAFCLCNLNDKRQVAELYRERELLLKEFKDKTVIKREGTFVQLSYYKGRTVNTFFFEKKDNELVLTNDTMQYPIYEIASFASLHSSSRAVYRKVVSDELHRLLNEMSRLGISNVSAEFGSVGLDMKIYFGDYKALLYVSDTANLKNERWRNYVHTGEKLDANWYYVKDER